MTNRPRISPTRPERGYTGRSGHFRDKTGERVGRLIVVGWAGFLRRRSYWECLCDCGRSVTSHLLTARSCGCLQEEAWARGRERGAARKRSSGQIYRLADGSTATVAQLAAMFHVKQNTMAHRVKNWPPERWGIKPRGSFKFKRRKRP
jgi:hypothetical protein